jgi:small GTP-binding protein
MINTWDYDYLCKVLLVGDAGVGKSSLLVRHVDDDFTSDNLSTIGVDFKLKTLELDNKVVKVQFWDTAGQERFRSITTGYYRGSNGIIVVYDVTSEQSFKNIQTWLEQIQEYASDDVKIMLVGNKADIRLRRVVDFKRGAELAKSLNIPFMETSAKESTNVHEAFDNIVREIISNQAFLENNKKNNGNVVPQPQPQEQSATCCKIA